MHGIAMTPHGKLKCMVKLKINLVKRIYLLILLYFHPWKIKVYGKNLGTKRIYLLIMLYLCLWEIKVHDKYIYVPWEIKVSVKTLQKVKKLNTKSLATIVTFIDYNKHTTILITNI